MQSKNFSVVFGVSALACVLLFQNCGGGFTPLDYSVSPQSPGSAEVATDPGQGGSQTPPQTPIVDPATPGLLHATTISELQGHTLKLGGTGELSFPDGLPRGAVYDSLQRRINWIPIKSQAGGYRFRVFEAGKDKGFIDLQVKPNPERVLQFGGPPFVYGDGDVGYIFVHGAGDVDRCADRNDLADYWGQGPQVISPNAENRTVVCYDSRRNVASVARDVANQILNAKCGAFNRCIIITHSMGGLLMEHMFLHIREALPSDREPAMYNNRALYHQVKERTLFVISLASAAGGSKSASIVNLQGASLGQAVVGTLSKFMGLNDDSTRNLVTNYASTVVAPYTEDPGVPFFMVGGYANKTLGEASLFQNVFGLLITPRSVFNGNREFAAIDSTTQFRSRSDGLVDFRSACGVASPSDDEGPGRSAEMDEHFRYCLNSKRKANHYVWFMTNMNHSIITGKPYNCRNSDYPCTVHIPNEAAATLIVNSSLTGSSAVEVIRSRLVGPALVPQVLNIRLAQRE